jgi:uncharacterized protein YbaP (TraB family)
MRRVDPFGRRWRAALAAVLATAFAAGPALADPPIWSVAEGEVTLFGSVHLLSEATSWKTARLNEALARADEVWFEIPFDPAAQSEAGAEALRRGLLPQGQSLSKILPPDLWAQAVEAGSRLGITAAQLDRLQPWLAEITLATTYLAARGARESLGVERQLYEATPPTTPRKAFETASEQIGFFADAARADQIASLRETLREMKEDPASFDRLAAAWAAGDVAVIEADAVEDLRRDAPGMYERLVATRNRRWTEEIERLVREKRRILIVVGVGHLVGPDSVPALLRRRGVAVEGP